MVLQDNGCIRMGQKGLKGLKRNLTILRFWHVIVIRYVPYIKSDPGEKAGSSLLHVGACVPLPPATEPCRSGKFSSVMVRDSIFFIMEIPLKAEEKF